MKISQIKHLVLSGGGMLGISYIGLVKYLEENLPNPIISNLLSITGCSAGAIFGSLISIGYTSNELNNIVNKMNFKEYMNITAESLINFMKVKGLESGKNLINFIKTYIKDKIGDENITFKEIKDKFNIKLQIGVSNLSKSRFELLNYINSPDLPIHKAISASIAIPFVFEPIIIGEDVYCDGGFLDNLPIENIINYNFDVDVEELEKEVVLEKEKDKNTAEETTKDTSKEESETDIDKPIIKIKPAEIIKPIESILGIYLLNEINNISKNNYQTISLSHYMSEVIHTLSTDFINKKIKLNNINNTKTEKNKIIIFKIPCDIMTFLKIKSSQEDIKNIIDIAYNTTKAAF